MLATLLMLQPGSILILLILAFALEVAYHLMKRFRTAPLGLTVQDPPAKDPPTKDPPKADDAEEDLDENGKPKPVPYKRFQQVNAERKAALEKEKAYQDRIAALEKAEKERKDGELSELDRLKKQSTEKDTDLAKAKADADAWANYQKARREAIKKALGDKWDEEYETVSLTALEKIAATLQVPLKDGRLPERDAPPDKKDYKKMSDKDFAAERARILAGG